MIYLSNTFYKTNINISNHGFSESSACACITRSIMPWQCHIIFNTTHNRLLNSYKLSSSGSSCFGCGFAMFVRGLKVNKTFFVYSFEWLKNKRAERTVENRCRNKEMTQIRDKKRDLFWDAFRDFEITLQSLASKQTKQSYRSTLLVWMRDVEPVNKSWKVSVLSRN